MRHLVSGSLTASLVIIGLSTLAPMARAFPQYSQARDDTYCRQCHGDFRANTYVSPSDGQNWGDLHDLHRNGMLGGDCETCHTGPSRFPVVLNSSDGGDGLEPLACVGCHGRDEDNGPPNPGPFGGRGAGLRQHHASAGVTVCQDCHLDAEPLNFTPAEENVLPSYYATPGNGHPDMPTGPCNTDGSENFAGISEGLDNDGDGDYDAADTDCGAVGVPLIADRGLSHLQNSPNPFKPETVIRYSVSTPGRTRLTVYAVTGELIRVLVDRDLTEGGPHQARWDGLDWNGKPVASGTYFCRLEGIGIAETRRMVLMR